MDKHVILVTASHMINAYDHRESVRTKLEKECGIKVDFRHDKPTTIETPNCVIIFLWPGVDSYLRGIRPDAIFEIDKWISAAKLDYMYPKAKHPADEEKIDLVGYIARFERLCNYDRIIKENKYMATITLPPIKNVIFNNPATIIFWADNTKTVVKCTNEDFDPEKGLAMAIAKKSFGNEGNYFNQIKKWTEKYYEDYERNTLNGLREQIAELSEAVKKINIPTFEIRKEKKDET